MPTVTTLAATVASSSALAALLALAPSRDAASGAAREATRHAAPAQVALDIATLHAATLSTARTPRDSTDAPFLMVTILGPRTARRAQQMPANTHWTIHQDEARGTTPLTALSLAPGDSVRVLLTLLESEQVNRAQETRVATALTGLKVTSGFTAGVVAPVLAPLTHSGAHWLGSAVMLLTNEGGSTYWRTFDCVATCGVSKAPGATKEETSLTSQAARPVAGVVELRGNGATYHLQVTAKRTS